MTFTSSNLEQKLNLLSDVELQKILLGFNWLKDNHNNAVILGGVAVVSYINGGRLLTPDLDIMVNDINLIKEVLDNQGLKYSNLINDLGISVQEFNLDILDGNTGNKQLNQLILSDPIEHKIYGNNYRIIRPELLVILKLELGRTKDISDGFELLKSDKLNQARYSQYLDELKDNLTEYESLKVYNQMFV